MVYTKKSCSNCGYEIQPLKVDNNDFEIDVPYSRCPRCGTYLIDKQKQEYIMFSWLSYVRYFGWMPLYGAVVGLLIGGLIALGYEEATSTAPPKVIFVISFLAMTALFLLLRYRVFKKEKKASIERTSSSSYLKMLLDMGLITVEKYTSLSKRMEMQSCDFNQVKKSGGSEMYSFCPKCGKKIDEGERFCSQCGLDLMVDEADADAKSDSAMDQLIKTQAIEIVKNMEANEIEQPDNEDDVDFGLIPEKPIFTLATELVAGQKKYLSSLSAVTGDKITWERRCSMSVDGINGLIDEYDTYLPSGELYKKLYINMYGARVSKKAPMGFVFQGNPITEDPDSDATKVVEQKGTPQSLTAVSNSRGIKGILPWILCIILLCMVLVLAFGNDSDVQNQNGTENGDVAILREKLQEANAENARYETELRKAESKIDFFDEHVVFVIEGYGNYYYTYDEMIELTDDGEFTFWAYNEDLAISEGYLAGDI